MEFDLWNFPWGGEDTNHYLNIMRLITGLWLVHILLLPGIPLQKMGEGFPLWSWRTYLKSGNYTVRIASAVLLIWNITQYINNDFSLNLSRFIIHFGLWLFCLGVMSREAEVRRAQYLLDSGGDVEEVKRVLARKW